MLPIEIALLLLSRREFAKALKAFSYLTLLASNSEHDYQAYISLCRANLLNSADENVNCNKPELILLLWVDGNAGLNNEFFLNLQEVAPLLGKLIIAGSVHESAMQDIIKTITARLPDLIIDTPAYQVDSISDFVSKQLTVGLLSEPEKLFVSYELAKFKSGQHLLELCLKQLCTEAMACEQALVVKVAEKQCLVADFSNGVVFSSHNFACDFPKHFQALSLLNVPASLIIAWHYHLNGGKVQANNLRLYDDAHFSVEILENWFLHRYQENVASFDGLVYKSTKDCKI